ncbi:MAG: hypothetical protein IJJ66_07975 [Treponema sp.]|nr:hypothetical protein [Treponema sp.]
MAKKANTNSTFDNLVVGISTSEREQMLNKMKKGRSVGQGQLNGPDQASGDGDSESDLNSQFKKQSFFRQIFLWLLATITNSSIDDVFNKFLVNQIAKGIEKEYPGLIDHKRKALIQGFYEKLVQLKKSADFFLPSIQAYEEDPESFYILLGYIIMPNVGVNIEKASDPYMYSFQKIITKEMRASLIAKMEAILDEIPMQKKNEVYACVRCVEWLKQFVKIPFGKMISRFYKSETNTKETLYAQIKADFPDFARVMCNYVPITDELIQTLYMFNEHRGLVSGFESLDQVAQAGTDFVNSAAGEFSAIKTFAQTVPMYNLAKVVFENSLYFPEAYGGGEDWLIRYRAKWKSLFDQRWEQWNRDYKKEKIKEKIKGYFEMADFPMFPFRPWAKFANTSISFHYDLTIGFINGFMKNVYKLYLPPLDTAAVEGEFALRQNRLEYTDTFNLFSTVKDKLDVFANQLSAGGEFGLRFGSYDGVEHLGKIELQELASLMESVEDSAREIVNGFGKACRSMVDLIGGMLGEKVTPYYGPLTNIAKIAGHDNKKFRERLAQARNGIQHSYEVVQEMEPLDSTQV